MIKSPRGATLFVFSLGYGLLCALALTLLHFSSCFAQPLPLRGYLTAHDPSTITPSKGRYYLFYTGQGILSKSSADKVFWTPGPSVFTNVPAWTTNAVPGFAGVFWAPDLLYFANQYHLYYAVSTFGSQVSAIGLATSPTLDPTDPSYHWTDQGPVITSTNGSPYNTIDPSFTWDSSSNLWMAFGSYWNGIYLVQLNATNGLRLSPNSPTYQLAYNSSIEASYLWQRGNYYYLFVNWGSCCSGVNSTYNIRVGRSTSVIGPYLDRSGVNMANNGGTLFLKGTGKYVGPGHVGILSDGGTQWLSCHYYDANSWAPQYSAYGSPNFLLAPLSWTGDDWPVVTNDWSAIYRFQADARDDNGQYYGLLENSASIRPDPVYGHVLNLNGVNQYVWLPPGVGYAQTFVAVVNWRGGAPWQRVFDFGYDTTRTVMMTATSDANVLRCDINPGGNLQTIQWTNPLPTNVWTHVALTLNGSQGVLYVNGAPVVTNAGMNLLPLNVAPQTNHLGRSKFAADPYFNGQYACFRVYGRALSPAEIIAPVPTIAQPASGSYFWPGSTIGFSGSSTDFADRPLGASNLIWQVNYIPASLTNIVVVFGPTNGIANGSFTIPATGPAATNGFYQVLLSAVDSAGRAATNSVSIYPATAAAPTNWASYYAFTSGAQDASNLYNGTLINGASILSDPVRGNVLNLLPGAAQYVHLPAGVGAAQTVSGWVKWNGGGSWQRVFDFGRNTSQFFFFTPSDASNLPQCAITPNLAVYNQVIESPVPMPSNQWTHLAVVLDGRQGILYLNGNSVAVNNSVNLLPSDLASTNCNFGKSQFPADPYFNGRLSAIHLNSSALSLAQLVAPLPAITQPTNGSLFAGGQALGFAGAATDYAGAPLSSNAFAWSGEFHSNGLTFASFGPLSGVTNGAYIVPTNAAPITNVFYRLYLTVMDTNGNQQTTSQDIGPQTSQLTLQTVPPGLQLALDGQSFTTTTSLVAVVGMSRLLAAPSPQTQAGSNYQFVIWSDGGHSSHSVLVPSSNALFTASYVQPQLDLSYSAGDIRLAWPTWAGAMTLYAATNLTAPVVWSSVTDAPAISNGVYTLQVPATNGNLFYRLRSP